MKVNQKGFTLIELIVVIVILGILSATALPKFFDLARDARIASLNAARGSLAATGAMAHGSWLVTNPKPASVTAEGTVVTFATTVDSGYPLADANLATAAGLNATDYTITVAAATHTLTVSPLSAVDATTCNVVYTEPTATTSPPAIVIDDSGC